MLSHATEDYLKAIYELAEDCDKVTTSALAERLEVAPASVTGMVQKLAGAKPQLVNYERHRGVTLTPAGEKIALEIIRHHRLIELYLAEELGYAWDQVDAEAEKLEHVISEEFEDRIAARLGHPTTDPHGDPIPAKDGEVVPYSRQSLSDAEPETVVRIARVRDDDPAFLRYLSELGLNLQTQIRVLERAPFDGPIHIGVGEKRHALNRNITDRIFVERD